MNPQLYDPLTHHRPQGKARWSWNVLALLAWCALAWGGTARPSEEDRKFYDSYTHTNWVRIEGRLVGGGVAFWEGAWRLEGSTIRGFIEVEPAFPDAVTQKPKSKIRASGQAAIPVRSLRTKSLPGGPSGPGMEQRMYEVLRADDHPDLVFRLRELKVQDLQKDNVPSLPFQADGELLVAGRTNRISLRISAQRLSSEELKLWGEGSPSLSDLGTRDPAPLLAEFHFDDRITISFEWFLKERRPLPER